MKLQRTPVTTVMLIMAVVGFTMGCESIPTLLDEREESLGIKDNVWGTNHRIFHHILHYPNGIGLRAPGYVVGIEKARQKAIGGPQYNAGLTRIPTEGERNTKAYERIRDQSKAHFISHVMKYEIDQGAHAVFPGRMRPCALYSALPASGLDEKPKMVTWDNKRAGRHLFAGCADEVKANENKKVNENKKGAFVQGWKALKTLRKNLRDTLKPKNGYTHILVIAMGWNTPQDNAVQNYNSFIGHLLDEVEAECKRRGVARKNSTDRVCKFKPLIIGVTWASDWELSDLLPIPDALVRLVSFPNKANDAKEVGVTWLKAVLEQAVLPARAAAATSPRLIVISHSFGARASLAALTQPPALVPQNGNQEENERNAQYADGDMFIGLQGAFRVKEIFEGEDIDGRVSKRFRKDGLRAVFTSSRFDAANKTAFWDTYTGMIAAHKKICGNPAKVAKAASQGITCAYIPDHEGQDDAKYGLSLCKRFLAPDQLGKWGDFAGSPLDISAWKQSENAVLYVDTTTLMTCRAAFTGGGSHSDIYRRETASFLWDLIR